MPIDKIDKDQEMTTEKTHMEKLQAKASCLSAARDDLTALMDAMQREVAQVQEEWLPDIRQTARKVALEQTLLMQLIEDAPELFKKPRTQVVAGLKFGLQKQRGKVTWDSDEEVCIRIDRAVAMGYLKPEEVELLVKTTRKPLARALAELDGKLLKRLGITVHADTDAVVIKSVDGGVEKAVRAMIAEVLDAQELEVAS